MKYLLIVVVLLLMAGCYSWPVDGVPNSPVTGAGRLAATVTSSNFMLPLSILGVALGVTAMCMGVGKIGLPAILGSLAALVLTLVTQRYASLMAGLGALAAAGALVLGIVWKYRSVAGQAASVGTALKEVVKGVQKVKTYVEDKFGGPASRKTINVILAEEQVTPGTQELVQEIKSSSSS